MKRDETLIYIGVDNGLDGGLCALPASGAPPISMCVMPTQTTRKGREVDVVAVQEWLDGLGSHPDCLKAILEEPGGSKSYSAATSMAASFHALRATFTLCRVGFVRISPARWQSNVLGKCPKGTTKQAALTQARQLWPHETFLASSRCRTPHDGMVDAALLAHWGRTNRI